MRDNNKSLIARGLVASLVATLWLALSLTAFAQSDNASISGYVKDQAGAAVAGAKVTIKNETRAFERNPTANGEGYFVVTNLPPGNYTITIEANGFKAYKETGRALAPNLPTTLDATLQPGQVTETVTVTASVAQVQSETATVGRLVETKQVEYLQLNGRNPLFLAQVRPGVQGGALGGNSFGLTSGGLNINGGRTQDYLLTYDGAVGISTRSNGTSIGTADVEATQEVQILAANYNAEYGRASGGQVRIVTKSGTKDFHGVFYEYLRNAAFNANEWGRNRNTPANQPCDDPRFEKAQHCRPNPFRYNQFGYSLSGPVIITTGAPDEGMVLDFAEIKSIARQHVVDPWDHAFLAWRKDQPVIDFLATLPGHKTVLFDAPPTAEHLACTAFSMLDGLYRSRYGTELRLEQVRIYETPNCWADALRGT